MKGIKTVLGIPPDRIEPDDNKEWWRESLRPITAKINTEILDSLYYGKFEMTDETRINKIDRLVYNKKIFHFNNMKVGVSDEGQYNVSYINTPNGTEYFIEYLRKLPSDILRIFYNQYFNDEQDN